jgi:tight adherence protein B
MVVLAGILAAAMILLFRPPGGAAGRFRRAVGSGRWGHTGGVSATGDPSVRRTAWHVRLVAMWHRRRGAGQGGAELSLTLVVQQLAALLKGGRTPARLWDELWLVHYGRPEAGPRRAEDFAGRMHPPERPGPGRNGPSLSAGSLTVLGAVRAAAFRGLPVSETIRKSAPAAFPRAAGREPRIWLELAACFDIAEASGCPLADVLARFAAQLEVEDDADAARQTALAGPKATVSLLTWLPVMGLGLGMALGVDPLAMLFGTPLGMAALAAGVALTIAGRVWSARLVHAASGAVP